MTRALVLAALLALAAPAARGEEVLGAEAFRELAEGWTLHFESLGLPFGAEQYLPGDRSLWRAGEAGCERGRWWEEAGMICFSYETNPEPQCWQVIRRGADIFARSELDPDGTRELRMSRRERAPLACPGPSVGV